MPAVLTGILSSRDGKAQQMQREQAMTILKEAEEATRSFRQKGWKNFAVNGTFHYEISGSSYILAAGEASASGFTTAIVIADVYRDDNQKIATAPGTVDPSTKKVETTISWTQPYNSSVSSTKYLTRYKDNISYEETTYPEFNTGTKTQTAVAYTNGSPTDGQIQLGAGGGSDWCDPSLSITAIDLPKNGEANAVSAIAGQAAVGTGDNASGVSYANILISQPAVGPPGASISGTFDGYKTNAVFTEQNYAYLATDNHSHNVEIINLAAGTVCGGKYCEAGYFGLGGSSEADTVFALGNTGYMTNGNKLYKFDLTSKSGHRSQIGSSVTLTASAKKLIVVGNYAYLAIDSTSRQAEIVNLTTNQVVAYVAIAGAGRGRDIFVKPDGTILYLATGYIAGQPEFFVVNLPANPVGNQPFSQNYSTDGMDPQGVTVVTNNKAIIVGNNGFEYQVINLSNMLRCGQLNIDSGINAVSSITDSASRAYSYIITGDAGTEFKIIEGGPGGAAAANGTFESQTLDVCAAPFFLCYNVGFNHLTANVYKPNGTAVEFQVGVSDCTGAFTFIGPDPADRLNSHFTATGSGDVTLEAVVPFVGSISGYKNPGRCFRYKAFLTTNDTNTSPYIYDVTVNFSP